MLSRVEGIDVFLSGHTHNRIRKAIIVNDAIIIQSGCHGSFLGRIDLDVNNDGKIKSFKHKLIHIDDSIEKDEKVEEMVQSAREPYREMLEEKVGEIKTDLHRNLVLECPMDNLLLQSIQSYTGADLSFSNG